MLQGLTTIDKKLGNMIRFYCVIIAAICLIFLLESCTNVRSIKNKDGIVKLAKKDKKTLKSGKNMQVDTLNASIEEFISKVESSKTDASYEISDEDTDGLKANTVQSISNKRLPTLREQMKALADDQTQIRNNVNSLQQDVNEIKVSLDEIKDAVAVLNFSPNNTPTRGEKPEVEIETEQEFYNSNSDDFDNVEELDNFVESDEAVKAKKSNSTPSTVKPKLLKKNQAPAKTNKQKDGAENRAKHIESKKNEKKPEPSNFKATTKIQTTQPQVAPANNVKVVNNDNIGQALNYFSKKDYQRAINELNIVLTKHNDSETLASCSYWLGESYFRLGNYQNAIKFFEKTATTANSSKTEEAKVMLGESNLRMGKVQEARQAFQNFITTYPKSKYIPRAKKLLQQL